MAHIGQEFAFGAAGGLCGLFRFPQALFGVVTLGDILDDQHVSLFSAVLLLKTLGDNVGPNRTAAPVKIPVAQCIVFFQRTGFFADFADALQIVGMDYCLPCGSVRIL